MNEFTDSEGQLKSDDIGTESKWVRDYHNGGEDSDSGLGSIVLNCKHSAHMECLKKYKLQQQQLHAQSFELRLTGFAFDEFACPICKCICNGIMPTLPLSLDVSIQIDDDTISFLDIYMTVISDIVKAESRTSQ